MLGPVLVSYYVLSPQCRENNKVYATERSIGSLEWPFSLCMAIRLVYSALLSFRLQLVVTSFQTLRMWECEGISELECSESLPQPVTSSFMRTVPGTCLEIYIFLQPTCRWIFCCIHAVSKLILTLWWILFLQGWEQTLNLPLPATGIAHANLGCGNFCNLRLCEMFIRDLQLTPSVVPTSEKCAIALHLRLPAGSRAWHPTGMSRTKIFSFCSEMEPAISLTCVVFALIVVSFKKGGCSTNPENHKEGKLCFLAN